jgi:hypothetical protein
MRRVTKLAAVLGVCLGLASAGWAQKGKGNAGGKGHAGAAPSQNLPDRANKGGDERGQQRAAEVHEMNQTKKTAQKSKKTTTHGKAKGKAKTAGKSK